MDLLPCSLLLVYLVWVGEQVLEEEQEAEDLETLPGYAAGRRRCAGSPFLKLSLLNLWRCRLLALGTRTCSPALSQASPGWLWPQTQLPGLTTFWPVPVGDFALSAAAFRGRGGIVLRSGLGV